MFLIRCLLRVEQFENIYYNMTVYISKMVTLSIVSIPASYFLDPKPKLNVAWAGKTAEQLWIRWILKDVSIPQNSGIISLCDDKSAKEIANDVFHEQTKHVENDLRFIRQYIRRSTVVLLLFLAQIKLLTSLLKLIIQDIVVA